MWMVRPSDDLEVLGTLCRHLDGQDSRLPRASVPRNHNTVMTTKNLLLRQAAEHTHPVLLCLQRRWSNSPLAHGDLGWQYEGFVLRLQQHPASLGHRDHICGLRHGLYISPRPGSQGWKLQRGAVLSLDRLVDPWQRCGLFFCI